MIGALDERELEIADKTYRDRHFMIPTSNDRNLNLLMAQIRSRHENINQRFKKFGCMQQRYRHGLEKHRMVFEAVVNIVNLQLKRGGIQDVF